LKRDLYMLHDQHPDVSGARRVRAGSDAREWNRKGHGIFWVINDFIDRRLKKNVTKINSWFFEVDDKPKYLQLSLIEKGLMPSLIVESKRSYQTYFFAKRCRLDEFAEIQNRIISFYGADAKAKDPLRLLRAPGYLHMKDPAEPFECKVVWSSEVTYTPEVMRHFYPALDQPVASKREAKNHPSDSFFEAIFNLDHLDVLQKFSGSSYVRGERYSFKENANGKINIFVNSKGTHCFIDQERRIGAVGGGPTIWQWLKWYGHDSLTIKKAICEVLGIC
jgi:hypothetical protein